ncbi:pectinesterase family protein [Streptomyces sp. NPDC014892]|uniref:pectinesterase family protein n=1 Tax=Streptomyces sp. NPDC014892 TaxID=3364930 RepID=UPI0036FAAAC8
MTNTERGLSRRSFLSAATAVAATSGLVGGVLLGGAPTAAAATGAGITWRITGNQPTKDNLGYANMLLGIRQAMAGRVDSLGGSPVFVTDRNGASQYITVDIHASGQNGPIPTFIRLFLRRSDAYLMGWRGGVENGVGDIAWGNYFTLDPAAAPGGAAPLPGATAGDTRREYENLGGYTALANAGASREGMAIGAASLSEAVQRLQSAQRELSGLTLQQVAQAILQMIVGVSEAIRFRQQARETYLAITRGLALSITATHMAFHNNWGRLSRTFLLAVMAGTAVLATPLEIAGIIIGTTAVTATWLWTAHHSDIDTRGKHLLEGALLNVSPEGVGDYFTVQEAIDAVPDSGTNTIIIEKGVYHEVLSVPKNKSWLTIKGVTGNRADVVIYNTRCHGMINPSTGLKYGTQGSAVATFRPPNLTVRDLTISNTFDRKAHPEIDPYETQAVAVAAMGDRQVYRNVAIWSHQDTLLVKGETPTTQARQYFVDCHIRGDVDFVFGNATAVIDRSYVQVLYWPGGTVLAPNTDKSKKYGILITGSQILNDGSAPVRSMYLGRPWNNTADAWPQAVVRDSTVGQQNNDTHPWTDMVPQYSWTSARFKEYNNAGLGAGAGANAPKLTAAEAADYTAQKYLAGTDGWNPVG